MAIDDSVRHSPNFSPKNPLSCSFLGKRGVKDEIMNFDPRNVDVNNRESVEQLLRKKPDSFNQEKAMKASQAAGPLATWVVANVKYSRVLEKIRPLEDKQNKLKKYLAEHSSRGCLTISVLEIWKHRREKWTNSVLN